MSEDQYRKWVEDNYSSPIKEQLFDIYKESLYQPEKPTPEDNAARIAKTIAKACTLMARLSADQERTAKKIVWLTWVLAALTFALLAFTVALYEDAHFQTKRDQVEQHTDAQKK